MLLSLSACREPTPSLDQQREINVPARSEQTETAVMPADGWLNYSFTSVKADRPAEPLDLGFRVSSPQKTLFYAESLTRFQAGQRVKKNEEITFRLDNTGSLLTAKLVNLRYWWSAERLPASPEIPGYAEHSGSDLCRALRDQKDQGDGLLGALQLAMSIATGDWLTIIAKSFETEIFTGEQSETAADAIAHWGCGLTDPK